MLRSSPAAPSTRPARGLDPAARFERTVLGAAMSVMAFVIDRRVQGMARTRSLASS